MRSITRVALMAGVAAFFAGGMSAPSMAASKRVIFSVDGDTTCTKFFNNDPNIRQLKLRKSHNELTDGPHDNGVLFVNIDFGPNPALKLSNLSNSNLSGKGGSSSSSGFPTEIVEWTSTGAIPKAVNALLVKLVSTDRATVVFYPDALTGDAEPISFGKTISELSFCYGAGSGEIGYAPCTLSHTDLGAACNGRDGTFFVRYDVVGLATGDIQRPELCACGGVTTEACIPDPNKQNACTASSAGEILQNLSTQSVVTTSGSPCRVTVCTSFFGRQICQQQTITSPLPCTP